MESALGIKGSKEKDKRAGSVHLSARRIERLANRNLITDENYARYDVKVGACATLYPTPFIDINLYFIPSPPPSEEPRLLFHSLRPFSVFSCTIVSHRSYKSSRLIISNALWFCSTAHGIEVEYGYRRKEDCIYC